MEREQEAPGTRVWRIARWNWAYEYPHPEGGNVFGCGFISRERAREAMRQAKRRRSALSPESNPEGQ